MIRTVVSVEGMMCAMCEKHVNEAVKSSFDVISVVSDHSIKSTVIESSAVLDEDRLSQVIADAGYEVKGISSEKI